jgi:hypothetical protein
MSGRTNPIRWPIRDLARGEAQSHDDYRLPIGVHRSRNSPAHNVGRRRRSRDDDDAGTEYVYRRRPMGPKDRVAAGQAHQYPRDREARRRGWAGDPTDAPALHPVRAFLPARESKERLRSITTLRPGRPPSRRHHPDRNSGANGQHGLLANRTSSGAYRAHVSGEVRKRRPRTSFPLLAVARGFRRPVADASLTRG